MDRVIVTQPMIGICYMQVCTESDVTDKEILKVANSLNPAGTRNGWRKVARDNEEDEKLRPVKCEQYSNRKHFIIIC